MYLCDQPDTVLSHSIDKGYIRREGEPDTLCRGVQPKKFDHKKLLGGVVSPNGRWNTLKKVEKKVFYYISAAKK